MDEEEREEFLKKFEKESRLTVNRFPYIFCDPAIHFFSTARVLCTDPFCQKYTPVRFRESRILHILHNHPELPITETYNTVSAANVDGKKRSYCCPVPDVRTVT